MHLNHRRIIRGQRAALLAAGIPMVLYTVNDASRARQHLEDGVAAVITDHVDQVLQLSRASTDRVLIAQSVLRIGCPRRSRVEIGPGVAACQ